MDMLSLFRRKARRADGPAVDATDAVHMARTRARRRLVGAAVLVAAGVVVFPVLFETQPRPIPIDLPIEIPRKDGVPPLPAPGARPEPRATGPQPPQPEADARHAAHADATAADDPVITETPADAGREVAPPPRPALTVAPPRPKTQLAALPASAPASASAKRAMAAASKPVNAKAAASKPADSRAAASKPAGAKLAASKPADTKPVAGRSTDAERAQALLEGRAPPGKTTDTPAAASAGGRFAVLVGAFSEDSAAREARSKLERLGLKSYLQVTDTPGGKRIRVRVGPYASREEAERATAKIRSSALPAVVVGP